MNQNLINTDNLYPMGLDLQPVKLFNEGKFKMINWKTTLFGFISMLPLALNSISNIIPQPWAGLITAISGVIAFYHAKDKAPGA